MKRLLITLICLIACVCLFAQADPVYTCFPITSVLTVPETASATIDAGIAYLQDKYMEDELVILVDPALTDFGLYFNGELKLSQPHPQIAYGQPVVGEMFYGSLQKAFLYIQSPTYDGTTISFSLLFANEETFEDLSIHYLVVNKTTHAIAYRSTTDNISAPAAFTHTPTQTFSTETHRAVIYITESTGKIIQAASTTRVLPPFRMVIDGPLSIVMYWDTPVYEAAHFYLVNTDPTATEPITVNFTMVPIYNTGDLFYTFCDAHNGSCLNNGDDFTILPNTSVNEYKPSIELFGGLQGQLALNFVLTAGQYVISVPFFFVMPESSLILVIADSAGKDNYQALIDALTDSGFPYALYDPASGELDDETLSHIDYVIWSQSGIYPNVSYDELTFLQSFILELDGAIWVLGQNTAKSLGNTSFSAYANTTTQSFLQNVLLADITTPVSVSHQISSTEDSFFPAAVSFTLVNSGINAHHSTTAISPRTNSAAIMVDGDANVRAVAANNGGKVAALFDFDFDSIPADAIFDILFETIVWLPEDKDTSGITRPTTSLSVYPNPSKNFLNIAYKSDIPTKNTPEYAIFNIRGQKVLTGHLDPKNNTFTKQIDTSSLKISSGIYFVRVADEKTIKTSKVLIIK